MKSKFILLFLILYTPCLTSFVLLGKKEAKLPATPDIPEVTFHWSTDGNAPKLSDKEKFRDGSYANYSDAELTPILLEEAIAQWNTVRGSFLRFRIEMTTGDLALSRDDKVNNIVVQKSQSASTAAYATPEVADDSTEISDCDIVINDIKTSVQSFLSTVTHELGHCVGLGHPHTNYESIMSYSRGGSSYRLGTDDRAGAIYLYPDPSYVSDKPKELISCGSIRGSEKVGSGGLWIYYILTLPIVLMTVYRTRSS